MQARSSEIRTIAVKWLQGIFEILAFFPVLFTIGILLIPQEVWIWVASLLLLYLIGLILGRFLLKKARYAQIGAGLLISLLAAWLASDNIFAMGLIFAFGLMVLDRGIRLRGRKWSHNFPVMALWIGLLVYLVGGSIYSLAPALKVYFPYIAWPGLVYMLVTLFVINSQQLLSASLPVEDRPPLISSAILKNNRALVLITMAVIMGISFFHKLREGVIWLVKGMLRSIVAFMVFLTNFFYQPLDGGEQAPGQGGMELLPQGPTKGPSWIFIILEVLAVIASVIFLIILLWYGLKTIYKLLKKLYRYLRDILKEKMVFQEGVGFIDEKESLMDIADIGKAYIDRFQKWVGGLLERGPKWKELENNQHRIRFLYRNLLLKSMKAGYTYKDYLTPKETGRDIMKWSRDKAGEIDDLTENYEKVRYGQADIEDQKVQELASRFLHK